MCKLLECNFCGAFVKTNNSDAVSVTCWECIMEAQRVYDKPLKRNKVSQGFPKGWRFMREFVHVNGTVFRRGVEQPDLKNTLLPTPLTPKPKKHKSRSQKERGSLMSLARYQELKKNLKKETHKNTIVKIELELKKLEKHIR